MYFRGSNCLAERALDNVYPIMYLDCQYHRNYCASVICPLVLRGLIIPTISIRIIPHYNDRFLQEEERKLATQLMTELMPIKQTQVKPKARVITEEEKKFSAYTALRKVPYICDSS